MLFIPARKENRHGRIGWSPVLAAVSWAAPITVGSAPVKAVGPRNQRAPSAAIE
jgi:hypothetical protein